MPVQQIHALQNWVPLRLIPDENGVLVEWIHTGEKTFTEPFFEDSIAAIRRNTPRRLFRSVSTPDMLIEWAAEITFVPPAAIIFHVSRCGSTLLTQLLCTDPQNIVLSEVPLLDEILRLPFKNNEWREEKIINCLQAAVKFYAQVRNGAEQRFFIKTDSWHVHFYDLWRRAFPEVPFVLLYRNPAGVVRSQQKKPGLHAIPGLIEPELFGFDETPELNLDQHLARVLISYYKKMLSIAAVDPHTLLFDYRDGITTLAGRLYQLAGLVISPALQRRFELRSRFDAKEPARTFDAADKEDAEIPGYLAPAMVLYERLNRCRVI